MKDKNLSWMPDRKYQQAFSEKDNNPEKLDMRVSNLWWDMRLSPSSSK